MQGGWSPPCIVQKTARDIRPTQSPILVIEGVEDMISAFQLSAGRFQNLVIAMAAVLTMVLAACGTTPLSSPGATSSARQAAAITGSSAAQIVLAPTEVPNGFSRVDLPGGLRSPSTLRGQAIAQYQNGSSEYITSIAEVLDSNASAHSEFAVLSGSQPPNGTESSALQLGQESRAYSWSQPQQIVVLWREANAVCLVAGIGLDEDEVGRLATRQDDHVRALIHSA